MGTYMKVISESFPMNTNMTGFRWISKIFAKVCVLVLWTKVASALEGLRYCIITEILILLLIATFSKVPIPNDLFFVVFRQNWRGVQRLCLR